jgi:hypothetical protein
VPSKPAPKPKRSRGRPKGAKPATVASAIAAVEENGELYLFIQKHMADDPKQYGRKARAYKAASEKFGGPEGFSRTTIDRRWQTVSDVAPQFAKWASQFLPRWWRLKAAYTDDELDVLQKVQSRLPDWFIERILSDREAVNELRKKGENVQSTETDIREKTRRK